MKKAYRMAWLFVALLVFVAGMVAQAGTVKWYTTSVPEMAAHRGATHYALIKYGDLATSTSTNTALLLTNAVSAKTGVEFVELLLDQAFDTGNTNFTGSVDLKIGDGSDDDLFLTSTELASDGTEVWIKYGPPDSATITSTVTKQTVSLTDTNGVTALVVTNATVASTAAIGELGRKLYTSAGQIVFTLTPNGNEALDDNTSGEVRLYFRLTKFGR